MQYNALARTEDRRRSTGETHQALRGLLPADGSALTIPSARHAEQAQLEAAVLLKVCGLGGLSAHPLGIIRLRPEPEQLTLQLLNAPYVIWYWTELLLPRLTDETSDDPRDNVTGVPGLRCRREGHTVYLYRPGMPTRIVLTGFYPRWWDHALQRMHAEDPNVLQPQPDWTPVERAAYEAAAPSWLQPTGVFSPLLRRIRATSGPGPINSTDAWSTMGGFRLESTDGPACPDLIRLLGDGPTGMGWKVDHKRCTCLCDHDHDTCNIDFIDPATGAFVHYSNGRWGRTATEEHHQRITDLNTAALA